MTQYPVTQHPPTTACVLLVAADATLLETLSQAIRSQLRQLSTVTCTSITSALRQLKVVNFDAVVSDSRLSDADGLQLLSALQEQHLETPLLLLAGYAEQKLAEQAVELGAYDVIRKPIHWQYFARSLTSGLLASEVKRLRAALDQHELDNDTSTLLAGLKVLLVEDDEDNRDMQRAALESCQAQVVAVASVQAALRRFADFEPDIIVSDIRLPHEDGYSLIRKVRRRAASLGGEIPAIAVTAYAHEEERKFALAAGYQLHLAKPIDPAILVLAIARLCGRMDALPSASKRVSHFLAGNDPLG